MTLISRTYKDIDLNFTKHPMTGDIVKKIDISAIVGSLQNLFQTSNYERLFNPDLGCSMKQVLFQPIDGTTSGQIEYIVKQTISNFEPRVKLEGVLVQPDEDNNGYNVFVTFFYVNNPEPVTIRIFLERVR
jgi:phage baseplate assembly protein W